MKNKLLPILFTVLGFISVVALATFLPKMPFPILANLKCCSAWPLLEGRGL
jgi:hypothetical protein